MRPEIPIACSLTADELGDRVAGARELGARSLVGVVVADRRAVLRFEGERRGVDAFVEAERECCPFLAFDVRRDGERVELEILTPEGGEPVLRALVAGVVAGWECRPRMSRRDT